MKPKKAATPTEQPRERPIRGTPPAGVTHEQIAERARALWRERGQPEGRDLEHWFEAERQLRGDAAPAPPAPPRSSEVLTTEDIESDKDVDGLVMRPRE